MSFEVFTETEDESNALEIILNMIVDSKAILKDKVKKVIKEVVGEKMNKYNKEYCKMIISIKVS